ncbi:chitinase A1-like [Anneissia japonica]|uniref:chitinase A1-like n=1 Tax=Anneissia japonica TaxID=1529436 RepID=UPI0014259548|nr:chitinase A1-like [Anneissia japonica]
MVNVVDTVQINSTLSSFTYRFDNLTAGSTYTIKLTGRGFENEAEISTVSLPPTNLSVEGTPSGGVTLSWLAASGAERYEIFYSFQALVINRIQAPTVSSLTTTISTLYPGVEYTFEVIAVIGQGENIRKSEAVTVKATTEVPRVIGTASTDTTINATWFMNENAQNYSVYYSPSDGDQASPFVTEANSTTLSGLTPGEKYQVGVAANFANGTVQILSLIHI